MAAPLYVDTNEPKEIAARLEDLGVEVERKKIAPGDYVCGEVGIERKTISDFFRSLVNKRLFEQLRRLRDSYPVALMILEGDLQEVSEFKSPQAMLGAFVAIEVDERVPILTTADREQTATLLSVIWKRQDRTRASYGLRHKPKALDLGERQRFIVEGLPNVGETLAENLLEHFGSVQAVFNANAPSLRQVPKIGEGKAAEIARVVTAKYEGRQRRVDEEPKDA